MMARTRASLDRSSPVERLSGIGRKRSEALAKRGVYSIADFLKATASPTQRGELAPALGLRSEDLRSLRCWALSVPGTQRTGRSWRFLTAGCATAAIAIALISGGALTVGTSFYIPNDSNLTVVVVENDSLGRGAYSWTVEGVTEMVEPGVFRTTLSVEPVFDEAFSRELPGALPEGILLRGLSRQARIMGYESNVFVSEVRPEEVAPGWFKSSKTGTSNHPLRVEPVELPETETLSGRNVLFRFTAPGIDLPPVARRIATMRFEARLEETSSPSVLNRLRGGLVSASMKCSGLEARIGPPVPISFGDVELPVARQSIQTALDRRVKVECTWRSRVPGFFEAPDEMRGAKQFWGSTTVTEPVFGRFAFRVAGAQWLPYIAQIVGWPSLLVGVWLIRKGTSVNASS